MKRIASFSLLFIPLFLLLHPSRANAQDEYLRYTDFTYLDNIFSVKFHVEGLLLTMPIIELGSSTRLVLTFDDIDGDVKDYTFTFVHCDANWQPSNLPEMEYLEGFPGERIRQFNFSFKTLWPYTHYTLPLPNQDLRWLVSGNYLLKIYDDTNKQLAITRRFVVVDSKVSIRPEVLRAAQVNKFRTHQEIDFVVEHPRLNIRNPMQEVRATIIQNGRWDNAIIGVEPKFIRPNTLIFDYQDRVVFPGLREFRFLDLRSLRLVSFNIASVQRTDNGFVVQLKRDLPRSRQAYTTFEDINGNFLLATTDQEDNNLSGEYLETYFALEAEEPFPGREVYIFGGFTEWQMKPEFRMEYDAEAKAYLGGALLKQGYYDYMYAATPAEWDKPKKGGGDPEADLAFIEGSSFEAENEYTIIMYYRPYGSRFDQVVGVLSFSSEL